MTPKQIYGEIEGRLKQAGHHVLMKRVYAGGEMLMIDTKYPDVTVALGYGEKFNACSISLVVMFADGRCYDVDQIAVTELSEDLSTVFKTMYAVHPYGTMSTMYNSEEKMGEFVKFIIDHL